MNTSLAFSSKASLPNAQYFASYNSVKGSGSDTEEAHVPVATDGMVDDTHGGTDTTTEADLTTGTDVTTGFDVIAGVDVTAGIDVTTGVDVTIEIDVTTGVDVTIRTDVADVTTEAGADKTNVGGTVAITGRETEDDDDTTAVETDRSNERVIK